MADFHILKKVNNAFIIFRKLIFMFPSGKGNYRSTDNTKIWIRRGNSYKKMKRFLDERHK